MEKQSSNPGMNKQKVLKLFKKSNPLSVNNKSVYRQDYQSLLQSNWLRTQAISSLITILDKQLSEKLNALLQEEFKTDNKSSISRQKLKQTLTHYIKLMDPFIVTMLLSTQQDFILQTLQGLQIFKAMTKYILFPMNTDHGKGNHWFLTILKNPRYKSLINETSSQQPQLFILNSLPTSSQDSSVYMTNELSQQIVRLLQMFHPDEKILGKLTVHKVEKITHQSNSYDCGVFTVAYIEQFLMSYVYEKEIENLVRLRLWEKAEGKKQEDRSLNSKCQFVILKPSGLLRKCYRERLQKEIIVQNSSLIE